MTKLADLNIREGSNKEKVATVFLKAGDRDAAVKKAVSLGLQETTARTWCSQWAGGKKKAVKKTVVKPPAKKATAKPTAKKAVAKKTAVKREKIETSAAA
jgi:hypothetical protein